MATKVTSPSVIYQRFMKFLEEFAHKQEKILASQTGAFSRSHYRSSKINLFHFLNTSIIGNGSTLSDLSMNYFGMGSVRPSASALVQTKTKTPVSVFSALHKTTLALYSMDKKYKEHRVIAFDGTNEPVAPNEDEPDYIIYAKNKETIIRAGIHINAAYDVLNDKYLAIVTQDQRSKDERAAAMKMVKEIHEAYPGETFLFVMDRGYFSYPLCKLIESLGHKYLIRMKEREYSCLTYTELDHTEDQQISRILTHHQRKEEKENPQMKYLVKKSMRQIDQESEFIDFDCRVVAIEIGDNVWEGLITNLDEAEFPPEALGFIYHLRWRIEQSFSWLKYGIGMKRIHSIKAEYIIQEIYSSLIFYNLVSEIKKCVLESSQSDNKEEKQTTYEYQINTTKAIRAIRNTFTPKWTKNRTIRQITKAEFQALTEELLREKLPVRPERSFKRNLHPNRLIWFTYR